MSDFKFDLSKFSKDKLIELRNNAEKVKDTNGKKVKLQGQHAYTINKVTKDTVTLLNPWNTGEEIVLSRKTFENLDPKKCDVCYLDLNTIDKEE